MEKELKINILPIQNSNFNFSLFAKLFAEYEKNQLLYFAKTKEGLFGVSYLPYEKFEKKEFNSLDNPDLTKWYLYNLCLNNCKDENLQFHKFNKFRRSIDIVIGEDKLGQEVITIIPAYLGSKKMFGFVFNYKFVKNDDVEFSREVQKKSLSLDNNGNENKNYYIDKYRKIETFVNNNFSKLFQFNNVSVLQNFLQISALTLETKRYKFGDSNIDNSQFQGIKKYGPYQPIKMIDSNPKICFIYRNHEKNYSYKLYHALSGIAFSTFSGMEQMFHFKLNKDSVFGESVEEYSEKSIKSIISKIRERFPTDFIVPILIVPWSKDTANEEQHELYYKLKNLFLVNNMASQFISIDKVANDNTLKWSVSSLAIQIFSKLGGSPWVVIPKTSNCLIIGIGQAYQQNENSKIKKFFSYSILTDTTGLFKGIKILADANNSDDYARNLSKSLKDIVEKYSNVYNSFVIHTSFKINKKDIKTIKDTLDGMKGSEKNFAILRFDDRHDYLCFDTSFNSLVPLESSMVSLSRRDYLIWFEGQQYGQYNIRRRIGEPVKISVDYPQPKDVAAEKIKDYLQDAINLSGANWRGFNAKSIPVSLLYAQLISHFVSAFDKYDLNEIKIENITPWFL